MNIEEIRKLTEEGRQQKQREQAERQREEQMRQAAQQAAFRKRLQEEIPRQMKDVARQGVNRLVLGGERDKTVADRIADHFREKGFKAFVHTGEDEDSRFVYQITLVW